MSGLDLDALLDGAEQAALAGGAVVRDAYGLVADAREKGPGDWVSTADTASERAVRAVLAREAPAIPIHGEEEGGARASLEWLVDPLDGTTNFLHRFPVVGVSVALVQDGHPIVGVVHAPLLGETYRARRGGGTWCGGDRMMVSERDPAQAIVATGFPFRSRRHRIGEYLPVFERVLGAFEDVRRAAAATLDLAWVGAGVFEGFFEMGLGPWDVAAGALLVREAGGVVTDWSGDPSAWLSTGDVVAANPAVHAALLELIAAQG